MSDTEASPSLKWILAITFCSCLGPFAANTYLPAFTQMAQAFACHEVALSHSLAVYLISFAFSSLLIGSISDAKGRIPVFIGGMMLFSAACLGAATAQSISQLYFWRFLQGLGASAGPVICNAMVRDRYSGNVAMRVTALMAVLFGLAPAFAPVIGGQLVVHWGWQGVFVFLALLGILQMSVMVFMLDETMPRSLRISFSMKKLARNYLIGLKHPAFMFGAFAHGFCFMGCIVFAAGASDIVMNILGMGVTDFGYLTMPLVFSGMFGALVSSHLLKYIDGAKLMNVCMPILIAVCVVYLGLCLVLDPMYALVIIGPTVYQWLIAVVRPIMLVMNLDYFPRARGMASSVLQFFHTGAYAVTSALCIPLIYGHYWGYAAVMLLTSLAFSLCWVLSMHFRAQLALTASAVASQADSELK